MKEVPLIFSDPMVRAILEDRKTQTRRLTGQLLQPGDRIWVKETWATQPAWDWHAPREIRKGFESALFYAVDPGDHEGRGKWRSSMFMPRWASRITLEVTAPSRMERLSSITEEDIAAEGITAAPGMTLGQTFMELWDSLHKPEVCWYTDPFVCVHTFKRVTSSD